MKCLYLSKPVVDLVLSGKAPRAEVGVVIADIIRLMDDHNISISFVPRAVNRVVDCLAKLALYSSENSFYYGTTPLSVEALVMADWPD
ncbi:hypothetical protein Q3G72_006916 [Acer saccharum]|nr:hypothetical protein Q3G72_006916 [Acer saccharum]